LYANVQARPGGALRLEPSFSFERRNIMTIEILVCAPDGSQTLETREVPDDYFAVKEDAPVEQQQ
jgi:hypothetical protein